LGVHIRHAAQEVEQLCLTKGKRGDQVARLCAFIRLHCLETNMIPVRQEAQQAGLSIPRDRFSQRWGCRTDTALAKCDLWPEVRPCARDGVQFGVLGIACVLGTEE